MASEMVGPGLISEQQQNGTRKTTKRWRGTKRRLWADSGGAKPGVAMALHLQLYHGCRVQRATGRRSSLLNTATRYYMQVLRPRCAELRPSFHPLPIAQPTSLNCHSLPQQQSVRPSVLSPDALTSTACSSTTLPAMKSRCALHSVPNLKITSHYPVLIAEQQVPFM